MCYPFLQKKGRTIWNLDYIYIYSLDHFYFLLPFTFRKLPFLQEYFLL